MANYFACIIATLLSLICALEAIGQQPYCDRNETSIRYTPVVKTRTEVKNPTGVFKSFKKTKTYIVSYIEQEEHVQWKMISGCCEGYRMSPELKICEPQCSQGCPQHANCVEPNRCQCKRGYISAIASTNGSHYCEPICELGCPTNGRCAEPNICDCLKGYHAAAGQCIEKAAVVTEKQLDSTVEGVENQFESTAITVEQQFDSTVEEETSSVKYDESAIAVEQENQYTMDLDENEKIYLSTPSTETYEDASDQNVNAKCTTGYIFYNGECRALVFPSNEVDCRIKSCAENAVCQSNGTCACAEGYVWHKIGNIELSHVKRTLEGSGDSEESSSEEESEDFDKLDFVSNAELMCVSLLQLNARRLDRADSTTSAYDIEGSDGLFGVLLVVVFAIVILSALIFIGLKLLRRQSGELDVEAKNDLRCVYDNKQQIIVL